MKKEVFLIVSLGLIPITFFTVQAAKRGGKNIHATLFPARTDFKKVKRDDVNEINKITTEAKGIQEPSQKLAKLEQLSSIETKTNDEAINTLLYNLGKTLGIFRGLNQVDEYFKMAQARLSDDLDTLISEIEGSSASKIAKKAFHELKDSAKSSLAAFAHALEEGTIKPQMNVPKTTDIKRGGYFANVFGVQAESVVECAPKNERKKCHRKCIQYHERSGHKRCAKFTKCYKPE